MGRSKRPLSLGRSAGARLTVMRRAGNSNCAFCSAARTRSLLSFTSASGRPTMVKAGQAIGDMSFHRNQRRHPCLRWRGYKESLAACRKILSQDQSTINTKHIAEITLFHRYGASIIFNCPRYPPKISALFRFRQIIQRFCWNIQLV